MKRGKKISRRIISLTAVVFYLAAACMPALAAEQPLQARPVEDGMYKLVSGVHNGYVWDINMASAEDGANLQLYADNGSNAQKFRFQYVSDGYYTITNANSGKAVGCFADELTDHVNLQQGTFASLQLQLWRLESRENGYYALICKENGLAADVASGAAQNGANLQACEPNYAASQEFRLVRTEAKKDAAAGAQAAEHSKWFYYGLTFLLVAVEAVVILGAASIWDKKKPDKGKE